LFCIKIEELHARWNYEYFEIAPGVQNISDGTDEKYYVKNAKIFEEIYNNVRKKYVIVISK
jgi:hypothetical protein